MNDLATLAINAHGGLERWRRLKTVSAHLLQGGVLWKVKGHEGVLDDVQPDGRPAQGMGVSSAVRTAESTLVLQPDRVAIETTTVRSSRNGPIHASPSESQFESFWDRLQLAYSQGMRCGLHEWPFLLALPDVKTERT